MAETKLTADGEEVLYLMPEGIKPITRKWVWAGRAQAAVDAANQRAERAEAEAKRQEHLKELAREHWTVCQGWLAEIEQSLIVVTGQQCSTQENINFLVSQRDEALLKIAAVQRACETLMSEHTARQRERDEAIQNHRLVIERLAGALCPDSPAESAMAEFAIDAEGACQIIQRLRKERDQFRDAWKQEIQARKDKPDFKTYMELKHGTAGAILWALQNGEISRGKAAEALAEWAHGVEPQLPELPDAIPDDVTPLDLLRERDEARARAEKAEAKNAKPADELAQLRAHIAGEPARTRTAVVAELRQAGDGLQFSADHGTCGPSERARLTGLGVALGLQVAAKKCHNRADELEREAKEASNADPHA